MTKRLLILSGAMALAILLPVGALLGALLLEPPPYRLVAEPGPEWFDGRALASGAQAVVTLEADEHAARAAAQRRLETIPRASSQSMPGLHRYRAAETGESGLILSAGRHVLHLTAPDAATLDQALAALPFLAADERAGLFNAVDRHLPVLAASILAYALLLSVLMFRGMAWAACRAPAPGAAVLDEAELRARLRALDIEGATVEDRPDGDIVFSRSFKGARLRLRLRPDAKARVVRAISSGSAQGRGLASFRFQAWRGVPLGRGGWTEAAANTVREAGWTWRPVITFFRPIGG